MDKGGESRVRINPPSINSCSLCTPDVDHKGKCFACALLIIRAERRGCLAIFKEEPA